MFTNSPIATGLARVGGADPDLLASYPPARRHAVAAGGIVLMTAAMACAAFTLAVHDWLYVPWPVAAVGGVFWGFLIGNLDRFLMISTRRQAAPWQTIALAIPRVLLAIVVGFVIAEPLVQRVFSHEIVNQARVDKQHQLSVGEAQLSEQFATLPKLQLKAASLQATAASGGNETYANNPDYVNAEGNLSQAQAAVTRARLSLGCEVQGTCGDPSGCGPVCHEKEQILDERLAQTAADQRQLDSIRSTLERQDAATAKATERFANADLESVNNQIAKLIREKNQEEKTLLESYAAPIGLIDREEALAHLTSEYSSVAFTSWLFRLFLISVDITPILFKTLLLLGVKGPVEEAEEKLERNALARFDLVQNARDKAAKLEAKEIVVAKKDQLQAEAINRKKALEEIRQVHLDVYREVIAVWREQMDEWIKRMKAQAAAAAPPAPPTPVPPAGPSAAGQPVPPTGPLPVNPGLGPIPTHGSPIQMGLHPRPTRQPSPGAQHANGNQPVNGGAYASAGAPNGSTATNGSGSGGGRLPSPGTGGAARSARGVKFRRVRPSQTNPGAGYAAPRQPRRGLFGWRSPQR